MQVRAALRPTRQTMSTIMTFNLPETSKQNSSASAVTATEIRLAKRPVGMPTADAFELAAMTLLPPADGQVLVRNLFMSVDPSMRGRMNSGKSYVAPFEVGQVLEGRAIGVVLKSRAIGIRKGDIVQSRRGWRDRFVASAAELRIVDPSVKPLSAPLGVLGMPGLTAWTGLRLAELKASDCVFISAAAGAVGSIAGQIAKLRGCFVVGSAGSDEKVRVLTREFGFDAAFNYRQGNLPRQLAAAAPQGIDVYFDNVGGAHLDAALSCLTDHGRIAACGSIAGYNDQEPSAGPKNMFAVIARRLTIRGFIAADHEREMEQFLSEVAPLFASGRLKARETIVRGLDAAPQALIDLLSGGNVGKMIVQI
jgi:NADPH-dependent curcumin reductase CurA